MKLKKKAPRALEFIERVYSPGFLVDQLRLVNFGGIGRFFTSGSDTSFDTNEQFWSWLLNHYRAPLIWVKLNGFAVTDWFPRTPGIFHVQGSNYLRENAQHYFAERDGIRFIDYGGEISLVEGGMGAVRFKPLEIDQEMYYLATGTTDGYCHSGVPLMIPQSMLDSDQYPLHRKYTIWGKLRYLPDALTNRYLMHWRRVPQVAVVVDKMAATEREHIDITITPTVCYSADRALLQRKLDRDHSYYVTFASVKSGSIDELRKAVNWIEWYVDTYKGKILTNFDQQAPTFADVPFGLTNIMSGHIDAQLLVKHLSLNVDHAEIIADSINNAVIHNVKVTQKTIDFGEGNVFEGDISPIIADSIQESINAVRQSSISVEVRLLLLELGHHILELSREMPEYQLQEILSSYDTLTDELTRSNNKYMMYARRALQDLEQVGEFGGINAAAVTRLAKSISTAISDED